VKLTSTTERTLRYYDRKGLLRPSRHNEQGHRIYDDEDLLRFHKILTLKYLDYSLDDIGKYLEQDSKDFHASLKMQYELLLQKQRHIQRIVATIERVRAIVKDNDTIDPGFIMMMIHSIQHEGEQMQWFSERLPEEIMQTMFMNGVSVEERLEAEREVTLGLNDLLVMSKQGLAPEHSLVQERTHALKEMFERMLGQALHELSTSEVGKVLEEAERHFFPICLEPEFMHYLHEAFSYLRISELSAVTVEPQLSS